MNKRRSSNVWLIIQRYVGCEVKHISHAIHTNKTNNAINTSLSNPEIILYCA